MYYLNRDEIVEIKLIPRTPFSYPLPPWYEKPISWGFEEWVWRNKILNQTTGMGLELTKPTPNSKIAPTKRPLNSFLYRRLRCEMCVHVSVLYSV